MPAPQPSPTDSWLARRVGWLLAGTFAVGVAVRLLVVYQSLWYDEMYTIINFVVQPWGVLLGLVAPAGEAAPRYSPNNHVLFNVLAKLALPDTADVTLWVRLPSVLAGAAVGAALAWPVRKAAPAAALVVALIATLHPWLVAYSGYARGYALLTLLAVLATHALPTDAATPPAGWRRHLHWPYALLLAACCYTQPLAILLVPGHALVMLLLRRGAFLRWFTSAAAAGVIVAMLYAPFLRGARHYWSAPEKPSVTYAQFLDQSIRHAHAGYDERGAAYLALPLLVLVAGSALAWRRGLLRPAVVTFATASLLGVVMPFVVPLAGEVRAMFWLVPLYCVGTTALVSDPEGPAATAANRWTARAGLALLLALLAWQVRTVATVPAQPIRDAIARAQRLHGDERRVVGVYMAAREAQALYGGPSTGTGLDVIAYTLAELRALEADTRGQLALVIFYERFIARDQPALWAYLQQHYQRVEHLPGRIEPAGIYVRRVPRSVQREEGNE